MLHSTSAESILNRKAITKERLFRYLHSKKIAITSEFTKQLLIEKILLYWKDQFFFASNQDDGDDENEMISIPTTTNISNEFDQPQNFPINQMARNFATWFFENLNSNKLQAADFWGNCKCDVKFMENRQCLMEEQYINAEAVLELCQSLQTKYELFLNLNESHTGTQGRIDCHGLVLVLTCGTLHKTDEIVGTFECIFGLSRDPFSHNNWKINRMDLRLNNFGTRNSGNSLVSHHYQQPTLTESDSMSPLLNLSMPNGEFG